jgi:AcrR family transcriptional regulator
MDYEDHRPRVAAQRRERMRARLIEGAMNLVARNGPVATTIDDVIAEAQVSRGTFYKYFDAPASLVEAVAKDLSNEILRLIDPVVQQSEDPVVRMATGMRLALRLSNQHPTMGGFIVRLGWPHLPPDQLMFEYVPRDLELGMLQGKFVRMDMRVAMSLVAGILMGSIHTLLSGTAPADFPEQAAATVLMGLGVDRVTAHKVANARLKPIKIDGEGLIARTLAKSIAIRTD